MLGFDVNVKLSEDMARSFKSKGYEFVIRYVGRERQSASIDIDKAEVGNILKAGLQLGIVQHCPPKPGILPSADLGTLWGKNAVKFAGEAGYKDGCILYLDLEDVNPIYKTDKQKIIDFCNCWYDQVLMGGYVPGVYIGFNVWLTGDELYGKLKFKHYWKSFSSVPDITKRGYEMIQKQQITVNGVYIDPNDAMVDKLGNSPIFMLPDVVPLKILKHTIKIFSDGSYEVV